MRILFLARSLDRGGAERQLALLAAGLKQRGHTVGVALFYRGGIFEQPLHQAGIPVHDLGKRSRWHVVTFLWRLIRLVRQQRPDILHSYLVEPNLLALLLRWFYPGVRIVWGVRASNMDLSRYDWLQRLAFDGSCWLSRWAHLIVANSRVGMLYHQEQGYPSNRLALVANGIDIELFQPDEMGRLRLRQQWGIEEHHLLVGIVARLDPMKDHVTFLRAATLASEQDSNLRFVCVGDGPDPYRVALSQQAEAWGLQDRLLWAGAHDDMPAVYTALDIGVSSSAFGEGFSNAVAEGMACGRSFVVTHVGDSADIVANNGIVVPVGDSQAMARGILTLAQRLCQQRDQYHQQARDSIVSRFSPQRLAQETEVLLQQLLTQTE
ncbi:MAG: glycosyltransferase [Magnetococcales bacterium]|nr:glycosyltransferase [Magnetococcales bacterium]